MSLIADFFIDKVECLIDECGCCNQPEAIKLTQSCSQCSSDPNRFKQGLQIRCHNVSICIYT